MKRPTTVLLETIRKKAHIEYYLDCEHAKGQCQCSTSLVASSPEEIEKHFAKEGFVLVNGKVFCPKHKPKESHVTNSAPKRYASQVTKA